MLAARRARSAEGRGVPTASGPCAAGSGSGQAPTISERSAMIGKVSCRSRGLRLLTPPLGWNPTPSEGVNSRMPLALFWLWGPWFRCPMSAACRARAAEGRGVPTASSPCAAGSESVHAPANIAENSSQTGLYSPHEASSKTAAVVAPAGLCGAVGGGIGRALSDDGRRCRACHRWCD